MFIIMFILLIFNIASGFKTLQVSIHHPLVAAAFVLFIQFFNQFFLIKSKKQLCFSATRKAGGNCLLPTICIFTVMLIIAPAHLPQSTDGEILHQRTYIIHVILQRNICEVT